MYEELVKRLRNEAECPDNYPEDSVLMREAADAIEELSKLVDESIPKDDAEIIIAEVAKHGWVPVTERLPEEYVNVLCHLRSLDRKSEYYSIDHLMNDGQWWKAANSWKYEVTHWMPLPQPPKEEWE